MTTERPTRPPSRLGLDPITTSLPPTGFKQVVVSGGPREENGHPLKPLRPSLVFRAPLVLETLFWARPLVVP